MGSLLLAVPGVAAAAVAWLLTPVVRALAVRVGALDLPAPGKVHATPIARLGGLAIVLSTAVAFGISAALAPGMLHHTLWLGLAVGVVPVLFVSVLDDVLRLTAGWKFLGHLAGAVTAVALGVTLPARVHLLGLELYLGWAAYPLSALWIAGVTNAFNLVDGLDGLSAGLAFVAAGSLTIMLVVTHQPGLAMAASILAGAALGFLPWNVHPARVFLGDTGATAIGFALGCLGLLGGAGLSSGFAILLPATILGVPIADTLVAMIRRLLNSGSRGVAGMFDGDTAHVHHRLLALGMSHGSAVLTLHGAGLSLAVAALISLRMTDMQAGALLVSLLIAALVGIRCLRYEEFRFRRPSGVLRFRFTAAGPGAFERAGDGALGGTEPSRSLSPLAAEGDTASGRLTALVSRR